MTIDMMRVASTRVNMGGVPRPAPCPPACCAPLTKAPISARDAEALAEALRVLAHPARLRLVSLLEAHEGGEACVCNLVAPVGLSQPTVTHHLQVLHRAGFLERERRGVWVYYRVVPARLASVRRALA
jgi:ArsR family transcriptional regulator